MKRLKRIWRQWLKKFFWGKTIKVRLIQYNLYIVSAIAIFVSIYNYVIANKNTIEIAKISLERNVNNISYRYEVAYEEMINIVLKCAEGNSFSLGRMNSNDLSSGGKNILVDIKLINEYCSISQYGNNIARLTVCYDNGNFIQAGYLSGSGNDPYSIKESKWFSDELDKPIERYQLDLVDSPFLIYQDIKLLPIMRRISNYGYSGKGGWVFLGISSKLFNNILKETNSGNEVVVVTSAGKKVASINEKDENIEENSRIAANILSRNIKKETFQMKVHNQQCLITYNKYERSGMLVYEIVPINLLVSDKTMVVQTILTIFFSCIAIGIILSIFFTKRIKEPINRLSLHLQNVAKGNFEQNSYIESDDEIGEIGKVVNEMSYRIKNLLELRVENEKEKKNLEIKMLQAQINPHFLYNTLDSIRWIAVIQKNSGIVKVVTALSCLLKNMSKGFNEKITLRQELDFLNDYMIIQRIRYVELFDLEIQIQDDFLYEAKIVKLTLQPLVENAIFSGIEPSGRAGKIKILAYTEENNLCVVVKDNGIGISPEKIETILTHTDEIKKDSMSGIGLKNVNHRLKLVYGDKYGLTIKSVQNEYTEIIVTISLEF